MIGAVLDTLSCATHKRELIEFRDEKRFKNEGEVTRMNKRPDL